MNERLKYFSFPKFCGITKKLNNESTKPKNGESKRNAFPKMRSDEIIRVCRTEKSH